MIVCIVWVRWWACGGCSSFLRTYPPGDAEPTAPPQVRDLLAKGADIEAVAEKGGCTALHVAAMIGREAVVREPSGRGRGGQEGSKSELNFGFNVLEVFSRD